MDGVGMEISKPKSNQFKMSSGFNSQFLLKFGMETEDYLEIYI